MPSALRLLWPVDDERPLPGAAEHQRSAQPGGIRADDDAVPSRVHVVSVPAAHNHVKLICYAGKHVRGARRTTRPPAAPGAAHGAGLTLQQVAEKAKIDISTLSRLEAGKRRLALDHLPALAAALGVSTDVLLGSVPPEDPRQ
jgi:hypothetical protein